MARERYIWEVSSGPSEPLGHAKLTISSSAVGLDAAVDASGNPVAIPEGTKRVVLRVRSQPVNYTDVEGVVPTAAFGFPLLADETLVYDGDPALLLLIRDVSATADAEARIAYYGND